MGSFQITKNLINVDLIEIIQFSLKIYDLCRHPMGRYMGLLVDGLVSEVISSH